MNEGVMIGTTSSFSFVESTSKGGRICVRFVSQCETAKASSLRKPKLNSFFNFEFKKLFTLEETVTRFVADEARARVLASGATSFFFFGY